MARRPLYVPLAAALAACGPGSIAPGGTETVDLTVEHRSEWRTLWLEGETNLPDGAHVNYRVTHALAADVPVGEWPAANLIESGRSTVRDGTYWAKISTFNWPAGEVRVVVRFPLPPQPPEVVERYGAFGEHLAGDGVKALQGMKTAEVEYAFTHRR